MYMTDKLNELRQVKDGVFKHDVRKESSPLLVRQSNIHKDKMDKIMKNKVTEIEELCKMYPNDADLGSEMRILIKNENKIK